MHVDRLFLFVSRVLANCASRETRKFRRITPIDDITVSYLASNTSIPSTVNSSIQLPDFIRIAPPLNPFSAQLKKLPKPLAFSSIRHQHPPTRIFFPPCSTATPNPRVTRIFPLLSERPDDNARLLRFYVAEKRNSVARATVKARTLSPLVP